MLVKNLKQFLSRYDDNTEVWLQVVPNEGVPWTMPYRISEIPASKPTKLVISVSHPNLKSMEQEENDK